jgi:LPXTG-site transpeptidase (sortase) family protein
MIDEYSWWQKLRFCSTTTVLYALTLLFAVAVLHPRGLLANARPVAYIKPQPAVHTAPAPAVVAISGIPDRIVIPSENVDLTVVVGYYVSSVAAWTLSGYDAEYANTSSPANNIGGNTFIYGHNNDYVFGALRHVTPTVGATALLYTTNGHIFAYNFVSVTSVAPDDVTALDYAGPPIMTIQTCTGSLNEWRTLYRFDFSKVVQ